MNRFYTAILTIAPLLATASAAKGQAPPAYANSSYAAQQLPSEIIRTFQQMDTRLGLHEGRMDRHDTRLDGHDRDISDLRQSYYDLGRRIAEMEQQRNLSPGKAVVPPPPLKPAALQEAEELPTNGMDRDFSKTRPIAADVSPIRPASSYSGYVSPGIYRVSGEGAYATHYVYRVVYNPATKQIVSWRRID